MKAWIGQSDHSSTRDSTGVAYVIYLAGCTLNCKGCHNPELQDRSNGKEVDVEDIKKEIEGNTLIDTVVFGGGEPFNQYKALRELAKFAKEQELNVWVYTGYSFLELSSLHETNLWRQDSLSELLDYFDVLVCGPYVQEKANEEYTFLASSNQEIWVKCQLGIVTTGPKAEAYIGFFWKEISEEDLITREARRSDMIGTSEKLGQNKET